MYSVSKGALIPNAGHPLNKGKVGWWLAHTRDLSIITDIIGSAHARLPPGTNGFRFGGPSRPGQLAPAFLTSQVSPGSPTLLASPRLNGLTGGSEGMSVGYWCYNFAGTVTSFILNKGTVFSGSNGTGWALEQSAGQRPRLTIGRATTRDSFATTDVTAVPKYQWVYVLWTWRAVGQTPVCYVNGQSKALTTIVTGAGAVSPEGAAAATFFSGNTCQCWVDDFAVWNHALTAQEAWEAFAGSSAGHVGTLLRQPFVFGSAVVNEFDDDTDDTLTWHDEFCHVNQLTQGVTWTPDDDAELGTTDTHTLIWSGFFGPPNDSDWADNMTWDWAQTFPPETTDAILWADAFLAEGVTPADQSLADTVTFSGTHAEIPWLLDGLTWSDGPYTAKDFFNTQDDDSINWAGSFDADTGQLGTGRYRR